MVNGSDGEEPVLKLSILNKKDRSHSIQGVTLFQLSDQSCWQIESYYLVHLSLCDQSSEKQQLI